MAVWTEEQKQVIELHGRNLLVSAAAGSGKTATLVERIIQMITRKEQPVDIDRLLVVTFTRAAAAEMRERIGKAIEEKRAKEPENMHLQKQALLLHSASIMTIDSFCLTVIQNYFHEIDLDPVFRVADEDELALMHHEVVGELLEEAYGEASEAFLSFSACYGGKHKDDLLEEYILRLYNFSQSCPWPKEWLSEQIELTRNEEKGIYTPDLTKLSETVTQYLNDCLRLVRQAICVCRQPDGPEFYEEALAEDERMLSELLQCEPEKLFLHFPLIEYKALSRKKMTCSEEKKEQVKALREQMKDTVKSLKAKFFFQSYEQMLEDIRAAAIPTRVLLQLTLRFSEMLSEKKREKRILDFSDVEHFALNILAEKREDGVYARPAACELRMHFEEIMVDEYQDSNEVQETILRSISREEAGSPNMFMVGDVKQSIYRFRMAKPELFLQKYNTYTKEASGYQKIELHKNFRSRAEVLASVNEVFDRLMEKEVGGIEYCDEVALHAGADYLPCEHNKIDSQTEFLLVDGAGQGNAEEAPEDGQAQEHITEASDEALPDEREYSEREQEAMVCARTIKKLVSGEFLVQKRSNSSEGGNEMVPCRYGDIAILLRTMSGWAEVFARVLSEQGIPVISDTRNGYFSTPEVKWLLNYLRCLDNPRQDIPFAGVLFSPFAGITTNEAAQFRSIYPKMPLYDAVLRYCEMQKDALAQKLHAFLEIFHGLRARSHILTVTELLREIYAKTGYEYYVSAMPAGEQRSENLQMFFSKAAAFEQSSCHSLFQFIRYVERLLKYEVDYGEAAVGGEVDAVHIMSIHRSKGLEFPVVFVSGMAKKFNFSDMNERIVFHPEDGVGLDYIDEENRTIVPTLKKRLMQSTMTEELIGEEIRLLYVAMTRAKEKLFLTGYTSDAEKLQKKWQINRPAAGAKLSLSVLRQAGSYLDFIGPILQELSHIRYYIVPVSETEVAKEHERENGLTYQEFLTEPEKLPYDDERLKQLWSYLQFSYPFEDTKDIPIKTSVSEIKKHSYPEDEFETQYLWTQPGDAQEEVPLPDFLKERKELRGTDRGTLYHRAMEFLPLSGITNAALAQNGLQKLVEQGRLKEEERKEISAEKLAAFYRSSLAARMAAAQKNGRLFREQPFVFAVPAGRVYGGQGTEPVLIQGIIDAFFEEEDGLVLVDYKTDYVPNDPEATLLRRYTMQMQLYADALRETTHKPVKEVWLYSFYLEREVKVEIENEENGYTL